MRRARNIAVLVLTLALPLFTASSALANDRPRFPQPPPDQRMEYLLAPGFVFCEEDLTIINLRNWRLNFLRDYPAVNPDGTINQIVEIPAGDNKKFETKPDTGRMVWDTKNGKPRYIKFVGYPGNYGAIPRTNGGDGDPLDVITLGQMELRADVVQAKVIGAIALLDGGAEDSKLVAVLPGTALYDVNDISELDAAFPGVTNVLFDFFSNYKGINSGVEVLGFVGAAQAQQILQNAMASFR